MDFDQNFAGPVDWNFPSPNATPSHHAYQHDIFQTPKTNSLPSHFQDAFSTPQMPSYATPKPQATTPNPFTSQPQYIPPNQTYGHPVWSPQAQWSGQVEQVQPQLSHGSVQTQTPPPTREHDARKVTYQPVAFGTPSTIASRRHFTPQHTATQQDPLQLHFPVVTQPFANAGPATAPVMSNFSWENAGTQPRRTALDDPFMSSVPNDMAWSFQASAGAPSLEEQVSQTVQRSIVASNEGTPIHMVSMSGSVDPSLVYSSPVPVIPYGRVAMPGSQTERRPRVSSKQHSRTNTDSSTELRPSLRRSNTTGSTRSSMLASMSSDMLERMSEVPPRTASPLKRVGRTPLGSISESKQRLRSSVILTIDENGLARTETQDDSPTRSMRARYPGLFDSDSSDNESNDDAQPNSRQASFVFSNRDERKQKAAKLDPPIEKFQGLTIPRSSSSASLRGATVTPSRAAVAAAASLRRQGSLRRTNSLRQTRRVAPIDTCPMNVADEQAWPGAETSPEKLHAPQFDFAPSIGVSTRRAKPPRAVMQNTLDAHNRRWSLMSTEQGYAASDIFGGSAQRPGQGSKKLRCVCGVPNEQGQAVVQCTVCTQWSHAGCVGYENGQAGAFTCLLCTKPPM